MSFKIKELPEEEKPREKAILRGVENLTIPELIAIIIKTGKFRHKLTLTQSLYL